MTKFYKFLISIIILALVCLIFFLAKSNILNLDSLKNLILSSGYFAPLIYIIAFALVPLTFFPDSVLAILGGSIFGLGGGFLYRRKYIFLYF